MAEAWIGVDEFYGILDKWQNRFEAEWVAALKLATKQVAGQVKFGRRPRDAERPPRAGIVDSSGADDLQGLGDADDAHALVLGHRQQRLVPGDDPIGFGRERGGDDRVVVRIGRDARYRRGPHQRGQCRIAIHELIDGQG